jgi:hypothetical protein
MGQGFRTMPMPGDEIPEKYTASTGRHRIPESDGRPAVPFDPP